MRSNAGAKQYRDMITTTNADDGIYEGFDTPTAANFVKVRKSESPKKVGDTTSSTSERFTTDKSTQTGSENENDYDDVDKKKKKNGSCVIL